MRVGLCPACGHVVRVTEVVATAAARSMARFYIVHEHGTDGAELAFVSGVVACVGSGDYVPAHRTRYDEDTPGAR